MLIQGNALHLPLRDESVHCVVTSPPYWGLRDYGTAKWEGGDPACAHQRGRPGAGRADGIVDDRAQRNRDGAGAMGGDCGKCGAHRIDSQLGLESTPQEYVEKMVAVFREVRRVLRDDGTLWLNLGDSYFSTTKGSGGPSDKQESNAGSWYETRKFVTPDGIKTKDLVGIPWRVAFALQADGWWLRSDIIWAKPNPMPESVIDRPTRSHEYLFLLTKSARYYWDREAVKERGTGLTHSKAGATGKNDDARKTGRAITKEAHPTGTRTGNNLGDAYFGVDWKIVGRNLRSVWTIATEPYKGAHFATFPQALVTPCVLAGSRSGDVVLDPFTGSGTVGVVCRKTQRRFVGIDLNVDYLRQAQVRVENKETELKTEGLPLFAGGER